MTVFWSLAAILVIMALLFTLPWMMRGGKLADTDPDQLNTEVIKAQLAELEADLNTGRLAQAQYEAARHDLERELLDDLSGGRRSTASRPARSGQWAAIVLLAGIPALAVGLYNSIGTKQIIPLLARAPSAPSAPAGQAPGQDKPHSIEEMTEKLAARLSQNPDDAQGWALLARSYESMKRYREAANAYANALRISGDHPALLADYADALVMANGGQFDDQSGDLLLRAEKIEPDNAKTLWLLGHWKKQQDDYAGAIQYWERAAALLPPDGQDAAVIAQQISAAREQLGGAGETAVAVADTPPAVATQAPVAGKAAIAVSVTLDPALAAQADPGDTVFIFARATQGPRMPLAIVRKQVSDLPATVTLDDSLAMSPAMVLSNFAQVTVGARISKSGNAMPQSGDLQGSVEPVEVTGAQAVDVTINSTVP